MSGRGDVPHYLGHRQRLRLRLERDPKSLADYEVLELLLGLALPRRDTKPLAKELLRRFQTLRDVLTAPRELLLEVDGFGPGLASLFALAHETWARLSESGVRERTALTGPEDVAEAARARFGHSPTEQCWVALLDVKNRVMAWECVARGTVDRAPSYPREILALALRHQAAGLILAHNHPGGDPAPSESDLEITRLLARSARDLGLRLLDHVIVCENSAFSFQKHGLL